ncbi:NAD(P)-binding protein [Viridothelium virens]|uniref:NAD(P)-binding protein n=1 Tax=Viridothelium virens TaxID=1048519 RepID=A0A6A6H119_VIRVR|nr:NAD(P)-binding protein [Viridothelium virens]
MPYQELLVILGATGNQGISVIEHFQKRYPDLKIRGLTRNPSSIASQNLKEKGVEMVVADMNDESSLTKAFEGATYIFAMTDFWAPFLRPDGKCPRETTLRRTMGHQQDAHGKRLGDVTQLIWPAFYMENFSNDQYVYMAPKKDASGTYVMRTPARADRPIHFLSARTDIGLYVAAMLAQPPPSAHKKIKPVVAYGEALTLNQVVETFQRVTGRKMKFEQMPPGEFEEREPMIGEEFQKMYDALTAPGNKSSLDVVGPEELGIDRRDLTSLAKYIEAYDWDRFFSD